jgi:hypothetical protein
MRFAIGALVASMAFGQTTKVFPFTQSQDRQQIDEIATVLRLTADIQPESIDYFTKSITVNATDGQIADAAWLTHQLDLPTNGQITGVYEYRPSSASEDVVRMFYVNHASTPQDLQYIAKCGAWDRACPSDFCLQCAARDRHARDQSTDLNGCVAYRSTQSARACGSSVAASVQNCR